MQVTSSRMAVVLSLIGFTLTVSGQLLFVEPTSMVLNAAMFALSLIFAALIWLLMLPSYALTLTKNIAGFVVAPKQTLAVHPSVKADVSDDAGYHYKTETILEALAGGVITTNLTGEVLYLNTSVEALLGYSYQEAIGLKLADILSVEGGSEHFVTEQLQQLNEAAYSGQHLRFESIQLLTKAGNSCCVELHIMRVQAESDNIVFIFRDIATGDKVINRLYTQASLDPLTGLMNRRSFEQYLEQSVKAASGVGRHHVLVSIDLDNFKVVNDTSGHQAGDELLRQVAVLFKRAVRRSDKVARRGGDEFVILLEECHSEKACSIMDSILRELRGFRFSWHDKLFNVSASMGILEFVAARELNVNELFERADKACYTAKALGRNQWSLAVEKGAIGLVTTDQRQADWAKLLQEAMEFNHFILFAQPILPLQAGNEAPFVHYEILLRLPFKKNLLSPGSFLPAADRLDMMARIDRWIIKRVFSTIAEYNIHASDGIEPRLMINLSSQAVQDAYLFEYISEQIKAFNINPRLLCFEISESVAIANFVQTKRLMRSLAELGVNLVLDDFGSGFSSLNYIRDLPLSYLKIDGNFVHNLVSNPVDAAMVKAVHEVGQVMKLYTIAELVEDAETLAQLISIGINFAQGYYCGRPFPFNELCQQGFAPVKAINKPANT